MVLIIIVSKQKNKIKNSVLICYNNIQAIVRHLYGAQPYLSEPHFVAITRTCGLPRYMNIALFRRIDYMHQRDERISLEQFAQYVYILANSSRLNHTNIYTYANSFLIIVVGLNYREIDMMMNHSFLIFSENLVVPGYYQKTFYPCWKVKKA